MLGGRGYGLTERFNISIVVQSLSSDRTVDSLPFSHSNSSEFNSERVGKIMLSSGEGVAENTARWEADLKGAGGVKPFMPASL